jgi:hypothetical protein
VEEANDHVGGRRSHGWLDDHVADDHVGGSMITWVADDHAGGSTLTILLLWSPVTTCRRDRFAPLTATGVMTDPATADLCQCRERKPYLS